MDTGIRKEIKKLWKAAAVFAAALIMCFGLASGYVVKADNSDYQVNITAGDDPSTECYKVEAEIYNSGKDFTGSLELILSANDYSNGSAYIQDITLPEKSTKTFSIMIPEEAISNNDSRIKVVIRDKKDRVSYEKSFFDVFSDDNYIMRTGLLSDHPDSLRYLDLGGDSVYMMTTEYKISLIDLAANTIVDSLDRIEMLIIDDYDISTLPDSTLESIKSWTGEGGILIIGTGARNDETFAAFGEDFTGIKSNGHADGDMQIFGTIIETDIADLYIDNNDNAAYSWSKIFTTYIDGSITIFESGLSKALFKDVDDYDLREMMSQTFTEAASNTNFILNSGLHTENRWQKTEISHYMEKPAGKAGSAIPVIVIIYIIIIGPILYLVLKKTGKRELCWIIIPAVSVIFLLIIFISSFGMRVRGLNIKTVEMQRAGSENKIAYMIGYSPEAENWAIAADTDYYSGHSLTTYYYYDNNTDTTGYNASFVQTPSGLICGYRPSSVFDEVMTVLYGKGDKTGFFDYDIERNGLYVEGEFTNNTGYDFDYVLVGAGASLSVVKNVKNGETVQLDQNSIVYSEGSSNYIPIENYVSDLYYDGDYESAKSAAALSMAAVDFYSNTSRTSNQTVIIGVRKNEGILSLDGNEESYTCIYMD